jgi:hypothetical protein
MGQNRSERVTSQGPSAPIVVESLRAATEAPKAADAAKAKEDGESRMPLFWRIFGGTIVSIIALAFVTVYQQFTGSLGDLRKDLEHVNTDLRKDISRVCETQGEMVKKDELTNRLSSVWNGFKDVQAQRDTLLRLQERCDILSEQCRASEQERRQAAQEMQKVREVLAAADERQALAREVQQLREKVAQLEGRQGGAGVAPAIHIQQPNH